MTLIKNLLFVGACALVELVQAAPIADVTVTNTVTQTYWTTRNCVKTVWKPAGESPTATSSPQGQSTTFRTSLSTSTSAVRTSTTSVYVPPPAPTTSVYVPPPAPTTSVYVAPTTVSPEPAPQPTTSAYTPPAPVTTDAPAYTPAAPATTTTTTTLPTPEAPAVVPSTASPAPAETSYVSQPGQFVSASASNTCQSTGDACEGDVTHYDGGLGACGWDVNTETDLAVALPVGFMGSQSNGNPYCGRTITIKNPTSGTTVQAKVGDKCMGCTGRAIDLTNKLFQAITDGTGDGRASGFQWWLE